MVQHIIVAVDGSRHAVHALRHAGQLAQARQAQLTLVHISNLQDLMQIEAESSALPILLERCLQRGRDILDQARSQLAEQQPEVRYQVHQGESWNGKREMAAQLVSFATAHDVDLIVLGSHGRSGLINLLMGSFIENVLRIAPCPLLIVRDIHL
jgi:nucleotide-binding universal stress UspA family protein